MHVVMTGGTAGFGQFAAAQLLGRGHQVCLGARRPDSLPSEIAGRADAEPLDLDRFESVRDFAARARQREPIDVLVLNAGLQLTAPATGSEGFERTFQVNHLSHYLLLRLLEDHLAHGARVILTASGTHDPAEGTPVTPPVHANAEWLAYPDRDPTAERSTRKAAFRAYSSSKLANVMTAREAARRHPALSVMSFDPGYVPWTGLGRENGRFLAAVASTILPLVLRKDRSSTIPVSGGFLASLADDESYGACRGQYWSVRNGQLLDVPPSELARDDDVCLALWEKSAEMVGL